jgi:signal peptidase I
VSGRSRLRDYGEALLVAVLLAVFARTFVVQAFKIPTGSMEENLLVGDHVLVNKLVLAPTASAVERALLPIREVRRGDVIVFRFPDDPGRDFIKRCVGLPGDRIRLVDKRLFLNGLPVEESALVVHQDPHVYPESRFLDETIRHRDNFGPYVVPPYHYFVLGDNRDLSNDSRFWGPVPRHLVKGRPLMVYWSVERPAPAGFDSGSGLLAAAGRAFSQILPRTRWERCLRVVR